jgi:hypothetical protein
MFIQLSSFGRFFNITLPDSRVVQINLDGTWSFVQPGPLVTPLPDNNYPHVGTTFQGFENGFMTWSATTGTIRVFITNQISNGVQNGEITTFEPAVYGRLAINTSGAVPQGRFRPTGGFGRVWSNFADVRNRIGWAITPEQGYLSRETGTTFELPDGRIVTQITSNTWSVSALPAPPTPYIPPTITPGPSPTPFPTVPTPTPTYTLTPISGTTSFVVGATFQSFETGFMIWRADNGTIMVYTAGNQRVTTFPIATYGALTINNNIPFPPGRRPAIRPDNGFGKVWSNYPNIRAQLGWGMGSEQGYTIDLAVRSSGAPVRFTLPNGGVAVTNDDLLWTVTGWSPYILTENGFALTVTSTASIAEASADQNQTPTPIAKVQAAYQRFEQGFMVWLSDNGAVYAFLDTGEVWLTQQSMYQNLADPTDQPPNVALLKPVNAFGKVWGNVPEVRSALGWAIQPEQCYVALVIPQSDYLIIDAPEHGVINISGTRWSIPSLGDQQQPAVGC